METEMEEEEEEEEEERVSLPNTSTTPPTEWHTPDTNTQRTDPLRSGGLADWLTFTSTTAKKILARKAAYSSPSMDSTQVSASSNIESAKAS